MSKRKCANCKERSEASVMLIKGLQAFCDKECLIEYASANVKKLAEKGRNIERKQLAEKKRKLNLNDKSLRRKAAQNAFNAYIRLRDKDQPCISCGRYHEGQYHAGHYLTRGAHPELAFEPLNCHKQCSACNNHLSGNIANYRIRLIDKIGLDKVEWLEGKHEPKKYTCDELKLIETTYKNKIKELIK